MNRNIPINHPKNFEFQIFCSFEATFILTAKYLFVWGNNVSGQLGFSLRTERTVPHILPSLHEKISALACGTHHTLCLTQNHTLYVWGSNEYGQLGVFDRNERYTPKLLELPHREKVAYIACGGYHSLCVTHDNLCYVWGYNNYGQLGLGDTVDKDHNLNLLTLPNNERISFITCGDHHTVCLTQNNLCYVWGYNNYGELGLGDRNHRSSPTLLTLPNKEKIAIICCGGNHTMCITEDDVFYSWGYNRHGQLGLGHLNHCFSPNVLDFPYHEKIYSLICSGSHSMCITENNLCYVWGENKCGELGLGDTNDRKRPSLFTLPNGEKVAYIACGFNHAVCLTDNNSIYVWGNNRCSQLGLGDRIQKFNPTPINLPTTVSR